jgi:REP element-mobilizing transposase RayT
MTRLARMVIPGLPHHVTQRGNRREAIFFEDGDHEIYCDMLAEQLRKSSVEVWAYCLMPNHVHLILNPQQSTSWPGPWEKRIADIPTSSMRVAGGPVICFRAGSPQTG